MKRKISLIIIAVISTLVLIALVAAVIAYLPDKIKEEKVINGLKSGTFTLGEVVDLLGDPDAFTTYSSEVDLNPQLSMWEISGNRELHINFYNEDDDFFERLLNGEYLLPDEEDNGNFSENESYMLVKWKRDKKATFAYIVDKDTHEKTTLF